MLVASFLYKRSQPSPKRLFCGFRQEGGSSPNLPFNGLALVFLSCFPPIQPQEVSQFLTYIIPAKMLSQDQLTSKVH